MREKIVDKLFMKICSLYDSYGQYFISVKRLPKKVGDRQIILNRQSDIKKNEVAVILQGIVRTKDNFTVDTIKFYKKIFPNAVVIISTWKNEKDEVVESMRTAGAEVLLLEPLKDNGCCNINAQLKCAKEGIQYAKKLGVNYIMKTRTDQRIYYPHTIEFLKTMLEVFPSNADENVRQESRIICTDNIGNYLFELPPFFMIDYFFFGKTEDIEKLYSVPFSKVKYKNLEDYKKKNNIKGEVDFYEQCKEDIPPEYYLCKYYLKEIGVDGDFFDREFYYSCLRKYFILISPVDIDLYWPKYNAKFYQPTNWLLNKNKQYETYNMNFMNYMNIYGTDLQ